MMVKVSVIMPVYNCESTIYKSINSVLAQTFSDFELIIVNDGSTDKTREICYEFTKKDKRVKLINEINSGPSIARNIGIENSTGNYLMFIDADDTYDADMLLKMVNNIKETKVDLVICGIRKCFHKNWSVYRQELIDHPSIVWSNKAIILENFIELLKSNLFNAPVNKLYKSEIIKKNNIRMDKTLDMGEDFLFNLNYLEYCNSVSIIEAKLYDYYIGENYLTFKYRKDMFENRKKTIYELRSFLLRNNLHDNIVNFLYIKLAYACFIQLFHKENPMKIYEKLKYIAQIVKREEVIGSLKSVKPKGVSQRLLVLIMKSRSPLFLFYVSWTMNFVRTKNLLRWKRVSL